MQCIFSLFINNSVDMLQYPYNNPVYMKNIKILQKPWCWSVVCNFWLSAGIVRMLWNISFMKMKKFENLVLLWFILSRICFTPYHINKGVTMHTIVLWYVNKFLLEKTEKVIWEYGCQLLLAVFPEAFW